MRLYTLLYKRKTYTTTIFHEGQPPELRRHSDDNRGKLNRTKKRNNCGYSSNMIRRVHFFSTLLTTEDLRYLTVMCDGLFVTDKCGNQS